ncbi:SH3 domain-containing protein [Streptomyces sp. NBC_01340]|uniref:SH3 domain-containing protein n=1 Tax=unclassified Streptomyces TaxID=2593676 RepID=UPI002255F39A|nr:MULTISPECIES: SH3 domain-containing protein [unclassified Streptomyces]MCX4459622.1 SH3 domain-containing protein [Streptomyces sp. NBC_01719]MCX4498980.1 SH3 domain-containing protein [Streptomyces sp. NBC_01728]WSI43410.1 SH3 domain-containing protein [Streptomyces sp. NBC_01340]
MRRIPAVITTCAATLTFLAPAGLAAAAPAVPAEQSYTVVPYENVNVRQLPTKDSAYLATLTAGQSYTAYCWTHGQTITDHGYTNDIWIGFADGFSSAVYFKGDQYANLPASAQC